MASRMASSIRMSFAGSREGFAVRETVEGGAGLDRFSAGAFRGRGVGDVRWEGLVDWQAARRRTAEMIIPLISSGDVLRDIAQRGHKVTFFALGGERLGILPVFERDGDP